jgi:hypothetical protein
MTRHNQLLRRSLAYFAYAPPKRPLLVEIQCVTLSLPACRVAYITEAEVLRDTDAQCRNRSLVSPQICSHATA